MEVAITNTQQGVITEAEFAKIAILTSNGRLVPTRALADDDRRDFEIHIRRHFRESLAVQLKTAKHLRLHGRSRVLQINFRVKAPLVSDEHLYYFLAHFDIKAMGYTDPVFLIPSTVFHKIADPQRKGAFHWFVMGANMEKRTRDKWEPYRVNTLDLGKHLLKIMNDLKKHRDRNLSLAKVPAAGGVLLLRQTTQRRGRLKKAVGTHRAAA